MLQFNTFFGLVIEAEFLERFDIPNRKHGKVIDAVISVADDCINSYIWVAGVIEKSRDIAVMHCVDTKQVAFRFRRAGDGRAVVVGMEEVQVK